MMESAIRGVLHLRHVYRAISLSLRVAQKSSEIGQKIVGCGSWLNQFHALWPLVVDTPRILVVARGGRRLEAELSQNGSRPIPPHVCSSPDTGDRPLLSISQKKENSIDCADCHMWRMTIETSCSLAWNIFE